MILGIGSDLVDIGRIDFLLNRFHKTFEERVFTSEEQAYCKQQRDPSATFAKRFAAKEACAKALGLGFQEGIRWIDIEVLNTPHGKPFLTLKGKASIRLQTLMKNEAPLHAKPCLELSLCDEGQLAQAFVVISYKI